MVGAFQSKQHNEDDIAESDGDKYHTDSVTLEEAIPDLKDMDKFGARASSEVDNIVMWERSRRCRLEAFRMCCTYIAIGCEGFWDCTSI